MAFLAAYFDDSKDRNSSMVVVAGIISTIEQWIAFEKKWRKILKVENICCFHMADFENREGEFKDFPEHRRIPFITELIRVMKDTAIKTFAHAIPISKFNKVKAEYPSIRTTPHRMCGDFCWLGMASMGRNTPAVDSIAIYFEQGSKIESSLVQLLRNRKDFVRQYLKISKIVKGFKDDTVPLQAADFLAYEVCKKLVGPNPSRKSFELFLHEGPDYTVHVCSEQQIRNGFEAMKKGKFPF